MATIEKIQVTAKRIVWKISNMFKINHNTNLMLPQENHQEKQDVGM